jgi:hypothetical protein
MKVDRRIIGYAGRRRRRGRRRGRQRRRRRSEERRGGAGRRRRRRGAGHVIRDTGTQLTFLLERKVDLNGGVDASHVAATQTQRLLAPAFGARQHARRHAAIRLAVAFRRNAGRQRVADRRVVRLILHARPSLLVAARQVLAQLRLGRVHLHMCPSLAFTDKVNRRRRRRRRG